MFEAFWREEKQIWDFFYKPHYGKSMANLYGMIHTANTSFKEAIMYTVAVKERKNEF